MLYVNIERINLSVIWRYFTILIHYFVKYCCRSLYGSVDWNVKEPRNELWLSGRSLYGSVDWNIFHIHIRIQNFVAPSMGAWIEILYGARISCAFSGRSLYGSVDWNRSVWYRYAEVERSLPLWERGLKFFKQFTIKKDYIVAPSMGAWIEIP